MRIILAFALLAILPLYATECSGSVSQYIPAVVGESGGLVNVTVALSPGMGNTYVAISPRVGLSTQESIEDAVDYAYALSKGKENCDMLVSFAADSSTRYIDGPSGGTALAVMAYSVITNKTIRNDTIITGTIDGHGNVGPVGGLYEKAKGAASIGARYFITPTENIYETLLLRDMERRYGVIVLQAQYVEDVIGFMTENKTLPQETLAKKKRGVPDIQKYDSSSFSTFTPLAANMIDLEENEINAIPNDGNETEAIRDFFASEIVRQKKILEQGYLFSAANEAFLNYIELGTIRVIISGNVDLPRKKGETGACVSGVKRPKITDTNFEWVIGSDLRRMWADDKIAEVNSTTGLTMDEKYIEYNELMYAQAWCAVAKGLVSAAPTNGTEIDETVWKEIAENKIAEARSLATKDGDLIKRLNIAQKSYQKGQYGAAIYDAVYVIETESAASISKPSNENASFLINQTRTSLWGKIYQSHAAFLFAQNQTLAAYKTALYAEALDQATEEMRSKIRPVSGSTAAINQTRDQSSVGIMTGSITDDLINEKNIGLLAVAAFSIFLLTIVIVDMSRRRHGTDSTRRGKVFGAKQKKGRT